jgi:hypothetical protein
VAQYGRKILMGPDILKLEFRFLGDPAQDQLYAAFRVVVRHLGSLDVAVKAAVPPFRVEFVFESQQKGGLSRLLGRAYGKILSSRDMGFNHVIIYAFQRVQTEMFLFSIGACNIEMAHITFSSRSLDQSDKALSRLSRFPSHYNPLDLQLKGI